MQSSAYVARFNKKQRFDDFDNSFRKQNKKNKKRNNSSKRAFLEQKER